MDESQDKTLIVISTAPDRATAQELALQLIETRGAACVQIIDGVFSFYRWKGELQQDREVLLLIKTASSRYQAVAEALAASHPYEVPEIVAIAAEHVSPAYARWLSESLSVDKEGF